MTIMNKLWVVLLVALTGAQFGYGLPVRPTPQAYPRGESLCIENLMFSIISRIGNDQNKQYMSSGLL